MFKQLFLAVLIVLFSVSMAVAGCILPAGTGVMMFTQGGMSRTSPTIDRPVVEASLQPTLDMLIEFGGKANEDWTDGVTVLDEQHAIYLLVHRKDLVGKCEVKVME